MTKSPSGAPGILEKEAPYWIYRYQRPERQGVWTKILPTTPPESAIPPTSAHIGDAPLPRYAHQVVYDLPSKTIYMHGGNAGLEKEMIVREGDDVPIEARDGRASGDATMNTGGEIRYRVLRGNSTMAETPADHGNETDASEDIESPGDRLDDFWSMKLRR